MGDLVSEAPSRRQFIEATAGLGLATALAGCGDDGGNGGEDGGGDGGTPTATPTPVPEFGISRIQFVAAEPTGYREYEPVPDKTYEVGGEVWVYFEPEGVATESAGSDSEHIELTLTAEFTDADGRVVNTVSRTLDRDLGAGQSSDELFLFAKKKIPEDGATGTWEVEVELTDEISGETTSFTREFEVVGRGRRSYMEVFLEGLESETDVRIQHFERDGKTVVLEYESTYETESDEWEGEIGWIGGLYAGLVGQGWSAERLSVTTVGSGGSTATWYVDRSDALAFANDEISSDEFAQRVFDTMSID